LSFEGMARKATLAVRRIEAYNEIVKSERNAG